MDEKPCKHELQSWTGIIVLLKSNTWFYVRAVEFVAGKAALA